MTAAMIMAATPVSVMATDTGSGASVQEQPAADPAPAAAAEPSAPAESSQPASSGNSSGSDSSGTSESGSGQSSSASSSESASEGSGSSSSSSSQTSTGGGASETTPSTGSSDTSARETASGTDTSGTAASTGSSASEAAPAQSSDSTQDTSASASASSDKSSQVKETEPEETREVEEADKHTGTNEQLISEQNIQDVDVPEFNTDFRFYAADSGDTQALAAKDEVTVYEETNTDSKKVGTLRKCASATKLRDVKDGWIFIESGEVRGFAKSEWFYQGDEASAKQKEFEENYISSKESEAESEVVTENAPTVTLTLHPLNRLNTQQFFAKKIETAQKEAADEAQKYLDDSRYGTALVSPADNGAYAYTRTTAQTHVTDKVPAFAKDSTSIYEEKSDSSTKAGTLDKDALAFVIESGGDWTYVESGDTRGFVKTSSLTTGDEAKNTFNSKKESDFATAKQLVKPSDNKATYYSIVSVKEGTKTSSVREAMVKMALSCAGNPYVWGGTSLTHGADCSGFVQTIYKSFGINLPRIACDQAKVGTQIKVSDAAPGDLIFFARNGYVYHVAMYAGDGKTIEAYSSKAGIGVHGLSGRPAVWACRILKD